jgi:hypothetical protein
LTLLAALAALLTACGVEFGGSNGGTEVFKEIEVEGELLANREVVLAVEVNQAYSVPLLVACYYEDPDDLTDDEKQIAFQERATFIGERELPASNAESPGDDVERQVLRFPFSVPEPGSYFAACLTPAAPENGIGTDFELRPAIDIVA